MNRPRLNEIKDSHTLHNYYYLLSELKDYCKEHDLPVSGGKQEITNRIAQFIDTGLVMKPTPKPKQMNRVEKITPDSVIETNIKCSEIHREFFKNAIGKQFTFKVAFQNWLKQNAGLTYQDAIDAYNTIIKEAKNKPTTISKQFEYNAYIRTIHADNPGLKHKDAITCWNYKKSRPGHNKYERTDLVALQQQK